MTERSSDELVQMHCEALGLHPKYRPLGDDHHTDRPFSLEDELIGDTLAYFLGTLFADYSMYRRHFDGSSVEEWKRVSRALRIHGLKIANIEESSAHIKAEHIAEKFTTEDFEAALPKPLPPMTEERRRAREVEAAEAFRLMEAQEAALRIAAAAMRLGVIEKALQEYVDFDQFGDTAPAQAAKAVRDALVEKLPA